MTVSEGELRLVDLREQLDGLYPNQLALLLIPLCGPHHGSAAPGKTPHERGWPKRALARFENGADRGQHLAAMAHHVASGGNLGLVVPSGALVLDADTPEAVRALETVLHDAPRQDTARGSHFIVRVPENLAIRSTVAVEIEQGVKVDLRSAGSAQIVVEPSIHATGTAYRWKRRLPVNSAELPELPAEWLARITAPSRTNGSCRIPEGQRNAELFRIGAAMRGRGESADVILTELRSVNAELCSPRLDSEEVEHIAASAARYEAGDTGAPVCTNTDHSANHTDLGNAQRLVRLHGANLRYCHSWARWLVWDGARWAIDNTGAVYRLAKLTVRSMYAEVPALGSEEQRKSLGRWARTSESVARIEAMLSLARSETGIPIDHVQLDADSWLLNAVNGTIELRTGELREHRRSDLLTKIAPVAYDPRASSSLWEAHLERVLSDPAGRDFFRCGVGYSLTGETREQVMFILYGGGANGKTTSIETLFSAFGDYALRTPAETLLVRRDGIPNDVARLRGARFVTAVESEEGRRLAEVRVKELTGGDTVSARFMRGEWFDFKPVAKLWLSTNHKPQVRGTDEAIWRRIRLIPFTVKIPEAERDKGLGEKLLAELPGVLAWAVRGCLEWQREGLRPPASVLAATSAYRAEEDILGAFVEDRCERGPGFWVSASDLFVAYSEWCEASGESPVKRRALGLALRERGFTDARVGKDRTRGWAGIGLRAEPADGKADATA